MTTPGPPAPRCYECLSHDVAVKLIGPYGWEHWFCSGCWADLQEFRARLWAVLDAGADALGIGGGHAGAVHDVPGHLRGEAEER